MLIYSETISNRLQYILGFIGNEISMDGFQTTNDKAGFADHTGPKINYSAEQIQPGEYRISPQGLLAEQGVREQAIRCFEWNDSIAFFRTEGDFPFDIFAASFYLLSRYEEYLPHEKDMYGRYAHENSLAFNENFLHLPLVNQWLLLFQKSLLQRFPAFTSKKNTFVFCPTYDIDEAYAYLYKGWTRNLGGAVKNLIRGEWKKCRERVKVVAGNMPDPYDAYAWLDALHVQHGLTPLYFFLVAAQTGKYDKHILPGKKAIQSLIAGTSKKYPTGIHPSWQSGDDHTLLKKEISLLESLTDHPVTVSRQHYIRFTLPVGFRLLIDAGIKEDYSMGYGSINGFRASVASSYYWYDLEREEPTDLWLHPFCYMEANSFYEQKQSAQEALEEMLHYLNEVKKVNGKLITIWHNTFLGTARLFAGWREIYQQFIKEATR